jgi:molecular chaperone HscB
MSEAGPFEVLGLAPRFAIDAAEARRAWMRRAAQAHPDASGGVDESARLNAAFRALQDPVSRAEALLAMRGAAPAPAAALPQAMLLELMEFRERVDAARGDAAAEAAVLAEAREARERSLGRVGDLLDGRGRAELAELATAVRAELAVVRAYDRVLEQIAREADGAAPA